MKKEAKRIKFEGFSLNLPAIFDAMVGTEEVILVEKNGRVFRLEAEPVQPDADIWAGYNPEQARQALKQSAGAHLGVDRDELLRDLHHQRGQDSSGRPA